MYFGLLVGLVSPSFLFFGEEPSGVSAVTTPTAQSLAPHNFNKSTLGGDIYGRQHVVSPISTAVPRGAFLRLAPTLPLVLKRSLEAVHHSTVSPPVPRRFGSGLGAWSLLHRPLPSLRGDDQRLVKGLEGRRCIGVGSEQKSLKACGKVDSVNTMLPEEAGVGLAKAFECLCAQPGACLVGAKER